MAVTGSRREGVLLYFCRCTLARLDGGGFKTKQDLLRRMSLELGERLILAAPAGCHPVHIACCLCCL